MSTVSQTIQAVASVNHERLETIFTEVFQGQVDDFDTPLTISEFECTVVRGNHDEPAPLVEVKVFGFAGDTTQTEFCQKTEDGKIEKVIEGGATVPIELDSGVKANFGLRDCQGLTTNEYLLTYALTRK